MESDRFEHNETKYYNNRWGATAEAFSPLNVWSIRRFWSKLNSSPINGNWIMLPHSPEARPLNIDPGYLTEAKLVLASTKDRDHRLSRRGHFGGEHTVFSRRHVATSLDLYPTTSTTIIISSSRVVAITCDKGPVNFDYARPRRASQRDESRVYEHQCFTSSWRVRCFPAR